MLALKFQFPTIARPPSYERHGYDGIDLVYSRILRGRPQVRVLPDSISCRSSLQLVRVQWGTSWKAALRHATASNAAQARIVVGGVSVAVAHPWQQRLFFLFQASFLSAGWRPSRSRTASSIRAATSGRTASSCGRSPRSPNNPTKVCSTTKWPATSSMGGTWCNRGTARRRCELIDACRWLTGEACDQMWMVFDRKKKIFPPNASFPPTFYPESSLSHFVRINTLLFLKTRRRSE